MAEKFSVAVIGSGPGGYSAAIRCAQKGASVAIIEKGPMGGTCLNVGCIPSKTLLGSAHALLIAKHAKMLGIDIDSATANWGNMQKRKEGVIQGFRKGLTGLIQANGIKIYKGKGIVTEPGKITVETSEGNEQIEAENIILATGSNPIEIPAFKFDGENIIRSEEALSLPEIPNSMVIIGGGVIGCEMGSLYAAVGCKVTIVEALSSLLPMEDEWVGKLIEREFKKNGIEVMTDQKVVSVDTSSGKAVVNLESGKNIETRKVLVSVGRKATCDQETIDNLGLEMNGKEIKINEKLQTTASGVYAIGDVVGTTYLAHGAFAEAEIVADNVTGSSESAPDYSLIPNAVYSFPEVASVGKNEKQCKQEGIEIKVGRAFFKANGRSVAHNETSGEIRVIKKKSSDKVLGVTMVGSTVTEQIAAARALIGTTEKITDISFPHPTVSEVLKESFEDAFDLSLHNPPTK